MIKSFFIFLFAAILQVAYTQTSSGTWNSKTATYTNATHKITWHLIEDWDWDGRPIKGDNELLKVRNDETQTMVSLIANKVGGGNVDIWEHVEDLVSDDIKISLQQAAENMGMEYLGTTAVKSQLCGIHAVKTCTKMKAYIPEYMQSVYSLEGSYTIFRNGYMYIAFLNAMLLEEEINDFDRFATRIFNGFKIK